MTLIVTIVDYTPTPYSNYQGLFFYGFGLGCRIWAGFEVRGLRVKGLHALPYVSSSGSDGKRRKDGGCTRDISILTVVIIGRKVGDSRLRALSSWAWNPEPKFSLALSVSKNPSRGLQFVTKHVGLGSVAQEPKTYCERVMVVEEMIATVAVMMTSISATTTMRVIPASATTTILGMMAGKTTMVMRWH